MFEENPQFLQETLNPHDFSAVVLATNLYSNSVLDHDMLGCFLELQATRLFQRKTAWPPVERQSSRNSAQSASAKPLSNMVEDF
jgi:hypothetical protein